MFRTIYEALSKRRKTGKGKRYKSEADKRLHRLIEDIANPIKIDWNLSDSDHRIIDSYVDMFIRDKCLDVNKMVVSQDLYPKLHKFIVALQGECPWQESMAAYDYLEDKWPQLTPLIDDA